MCVITIYITAILLFGCVSQQQVQKWYTLLGKKLDFAYQKNEKWQQKHTKNIPLWNMEHHQIYKKQFIITHL